MEPELLVDKAVVAVVERLMVSVTAAAVLA